jgi:similar to spore coat protein
MMNQIIENLTGTNRLTDQIIAADLLNSAKTGVKNIAVALTEASTPEVRGALKKQLNDAITAHENVFNYMSSKGWYNAKDMNEQLRMDIQNASAAMKLPE